MTHDKKSRVALLGGDGRVPPNRLPGVAVRVFRARRFSGNGPLRNLEAAIKAGAIDEVYILARWNSHSATSRVMRLCRRHRVPVTTLP